MQSSLHLAIGIKKLESIKKLVPNVMLYYIPVLLGKSQFFLLPDY